MQPERQVSVAFTGIALTLTLPGGVDALHGYSASSTARPIVGAILGAIGVLLGALVARSRSAKSAERISLTLWLLAAIVLGAAPAVIALQTAGEGRRTLLSIAALLPIAAWTFVISRAD